MKRKQILIYGSALILLTVAVIFTINYFTKTEINSDKPEFAEFIYAYTSGNISKVSDIKINLTPEVAAQLSSQKSIDKFLSFSPSIKGTYKFDNNILTFKPEKNLPSNEEYHAIFNLGDLVKVKPELKEFIFAFKTYEQSFDHEILEQITIDKKTLKYQQISGVVHTADFEGIDKLKQVFEATQNGNEIKIKWAEATDGLTHYFTVDSILRGEKKSELIFKWNGNKIDVDKKGKQEIIIPALGDFSFLSAKVVQQPDQYLLLQFSDPLDTKQNLKGLIKVTREKNLKFHIEDNTIKVFLSGRIDGTRVINIHAGIKNILGFKLKQKEQFTTAFESIKPEVKFIGEGNILPTTDKGLILPFEAVNIKAVDVTVYKIYENNIMQFLQVNDMDGEYQLRRVAKPMMRKKLMLDKFDIKDLGTWNRFSLDLNTIIEPEPGAIYRVELNFKRSYSVYSCENNDDSDDEEIEEEWNEENVESSNWDNYEEDYDYYYSGYWDDRDDPCKKAYYGKRRKVSKNIIASDLGLIVKQGNDKNINVFVADIKSAKPKEGVVVEVYDYQQQLLLTGTSDKNGEVKLGVAENPYFIIAKLGKQRAFLKMSDGNSLSLSRFDVAGVAVEKGLKGFIYGERGVWRPGDSLYLTFILKENLKPLPKGHPIIFEFKNPQGQIVQKEVMNKNKSNFYTFRTKTEADAKTGYYTLKVKVGTVEFSKSISIETVKPNRLKIKLDFGKKMIQEGDEPSTDIQVNWLHGAIGKDLKVVVDASLNPIMTSFPKYTDYVFDDLTKHFYGSPDRIFEGKTNSEGQINLIADLSAEEEAPGMMNAMFFTKVFEKGGNFSIDQYTVKFSPYKSYTGIKLPKGDKMRGMLLTDKKHTVEIVTLTPEGKLIKDQHTIKCRFYKIGWQWWWDQSANSISSYNFKSHSKLLKTETVHTKGGKATWDIEVEYPEWGRYLVIAKDLQTGHSTSKIVYIDWPGWAGRAQKGDAQGAAMLMFSSDKDKYDVGETAIIKFPSTKGGKAIINIENGTRLIESFVVDTKDKETEFKFKLKKTMTPNVYVNITLLQKHSQTANDLPIRMYGVIPIMVENPETHLNPVITMPDVLEAEKNVTIKISEKDNKAMTYTLAIVDEGLLDLTRFKTPKPWEHFYAREALGVKTWDLYDLIIGAYTGKLDRLLAVGGGADGNGDKKKTANRFTPVVKFLGPFTLKGGTKTHTFKMPKYIGSVRTMVIAGSGDAYGSTEKTTKVIKPLMVLGTLPRVLGINEEISLPVSIFAMNKTIKNAKVTVSTTGPVSIVGTASGQVTFSEPGEENINFKIKTSEKVGIAKVIITAKSGNKTSNFEIEIDVRNPNSKLTEVTGKVISAGQTWDASYTPFGVAGTNTAVLEVSSIPPVNLAKRLDYLVSYPHGCIEQTTSAAFPQLYLSKIMKLSSKTSADVKKNVNAAIKKLASFQLSNGGFSYWPGGSNATEWGTTYAGHFMIEAKNNAYPVSRDMIKNWLKYQKRKANNWTDDGPRSQIIQAYRLYTLALAGSPNKGAMNRLKEAKTLSISAKWRLAAAYSLSGKKSVALKMVEGLGVNIPVYSELSFTYGSDVRDRAMILETLSMLGKKAQAFALVKEISEELSSNKYMSTQTTAYSLIGISHYVIKNANNSGLKFSYSVNGGKTVNVSDKKSISQNTFTVQAGKNGKISIKNSGSSILYARVILQGIPTTGYAKESQNALRVAVKYMLPDGTSITPTEIAQGTDFVAEVSITHPGGVKAYKEMALTQIFPSGWEIINTRLYSFSSGKTTSTPTYQDIRDDRVYTYFDLGKAKTKTFRVMLNASYAGTYWMPQVKCEAMYDETIHARKGGGFVKVVIK